MTAHVTRISIIAVVLALLYACHAPVTVTTPQGKQSYTADQVVIRIGELQNAAIQANATGGLDTATTRQIVTYCVSTAKTLKETPQGWIATVQAGWNAFKPTLPVKVTADPSFAVLISSLDVLMAGLQ